jgi:trans-aconitate 2-methyltransferase
MSGPASHNVAASPARNIKQKMVEYAWDVPGYVRASAEQQVWGRELLDKLGLKGGERVLDVGCGDGRLTAEIARRVPGGSVLGVDVSENMIAFAREHYEAGAHPNLRFRVEDARDLPFLEEFDLVFSNAALHWVRGHQPVLAGARRSLKRGGRALLQMGGRGNAAEVLDVLDEMLGSEGWRDYFAGFVFPYGFYGPEEYEEWLREAGLRPLRVELVPKDMKHDGGAGLAGWIGSTWLPYVGRVPEAKRGDFVEDFVGRYLGRHPPDGRGRAHVKMVRLEVEAVKP